MDSVLIIGSVWPEPKSSAAGVRMMQLIGLFQGMGYKVKFACSIPESDFMVDLNTYSVEKINITINCSSFDLLVAEMNPNVVVFDRFITEEQFGWRVTENSPSSLKILDTEDLHFLRRYRMNSIAVDLDFDKLKMKDDTIREISSILRCDLSILISDFEMRLLEDNFSIPKSQLFYLPFPLPNFLSEVNFQERSGYCFIGNFYHRPNLDCIRTLKKEIWPRIRKVNPEAVINIYGAYPSQEVLEMHDCKGGFNVIGRVDDVKDVLVKHRLLLAPIRFGAGVKGKVVDAISVATLVLSTPIGFEGFGDAENWSEFSHDSFDAFVDTAERFYHDEILWNKSVSQQIRLMESVLNQEEIVKEFKTTVKYLTKNLDKFRNENYLIRLLNSDQLNAKKYMSKWIECKNSV